MCRRDKLCKTAIKSMVLSNHTLCGTVPITIYYSCPTLQHGKATPKYNYAGPRISILGRTRDFSRQDGQYNTLFDHLLLDKDKKISTKKYRFHKYITYIFIFY